MATDASQDERSMVNDSRETTSSASTKAGNLHGLNLTELSDKDARILSSQNKDFTPHTWTGLVQIIESGRLEQLQRNPSDLRRYLLYLAEIKQKYAGGVREFILRERLHWTLDELRPSKEYRNPVDCFANAKDWKILLNDWPYGLEEGIKHLVVWTKFHFDEEVNSEASGVGTALLTKEANAAIEKFVSVHFRQHVGIENVS